MPDDSTPLGDAMTRRFPQQKIPEPEPGSAQARERELAADVSRRPSLPDHPTPMAVDLGDEGDTQPSDERAHQDRGRFPGKQGG